MNTKFTKGEWFIERYHTMLDVSVVGKGSICTIDTDHVMDECMIDPTPEQEANAHLIAAAPDMYAEIQSDIEKLKASLDADGLGSMFYLDIKVIIEHKELLLTKARGE